MRNLIGPKTLKLLLAEGLLSIMVNVSENRKQMATSSFLWKENTVHTTENFCVEMSLQNNFVNK